MANRVYNTEELILQDDTEVVVKPLPIGPLRRFMEAWKSMGDLEEDDDGFDVFINCSGVALEHNFKKNGKNPGKFENLAPSAEEKAAGEFLSGEYKDYLLNTLDIDTIYKIMEVAGGIKLNDPKLMEALVEMNNQAQEDGKN